MTYSKVYKKYSRTSARPASRAATNRKILTRKPTAKNQKYQLLSINKKVNKLQRYVSRNAYQVQHRHFIQTSLANFIAPVVCMNLISPSFLTQCFSESTESRGGKYTGTWLKIDYQILPHTQPENIDCTVFFVTPKNQKVVVEAGGATTSTLETLDTDVDYIKLAGTGQVLMNKKRWNIHKVHRISTQPLVTATAQEAIINVTRANSRSFTMKNPLKINNRTGLWNAIADWEVAHNQRLHCFCFNNNIATVPGPQITSPQISFNILMSGFTSA